MCAVVEPIVNAGDAAECGGGDNSWIGFGGLNNIVSWMLVAGLLVLLPCCIALDVNEKVAKVDALIQEYNDRYHVPGMGVSIVYDGKVQVSLL